MRDAVSKDLIEGVSHCVALSLLSVVTFLTLGLVVRFLVRSNGLAVIGMAIIFTFVMTMVGTSFREVPAVIVFGVVFSAGTILSVFRFGFLALLSCTFVRLLAAFVPWGLDFSAWHADRTLIGAVVILLFTGYGFLTALGGQSILKDPLADTEPVELERGV